MFALFEESVASEANSFTIGASALAFHYKEFPDDQRFRNREDGWLPGVVAGLKFAPGAWRIRLGASYHGGKVDYDGATSAGNPHQTQTSTDIFDAIVTGGYAFALSESFNLSPYAGVGYRHWRRDILPKRGVSGLLETYYWPYAAAGAELSWLHSEQFHAGIDVRLMRPVNPKLDVNLGGQTTLDLGARLGYRVGVPMQWRFGKSQGLLLEPYYQRLEIGESPPKNGILEPRSETNIFAVNLSWQLRF